MPRRRFNEGVTPLTDTCHTSARRRSGLPRAALAAITWLLLPAMAHADEPEPAGTVPPVGFVELPTLSGDGDTRTIAPSSWPSPSLRAATVATVETHAAPAGDRAGRASLLAPLVAASLSVASAVAGGSLLLDTRLHFAELQAQCQGHCVAGDITPTEQRAYAGCALLAIGAAGAALSLVELALTLRSKRPPTASRSVPRVLLLPTAAGLVATGRF